MGEQLEGTGLEEKELRSIFELLDDDGEGEVCRKEFIVGMSKYRHSEALAKDMVPALKKCEKLERHLVQRRKELASSKNARPVKQTQSPSMSDACALLEQKLAEIEQGADA